MNQVNRDIRFCDRGLWLHLCFSVWPVSVICTGHATLAMLTAAILELVSQLEDHFWLCWTCSTTKISKCIQYRKMRIKLTCLKTKKINKNKTHFFLKDKDPNGKAPLVSSPSRRRRSTPSRAIQSLRQVTPQKHPSKHSYCLRVSDRTLCKRHKLVTFFKVR